jgi:hypothetical protein
VVAKNDDPIEGSAVVDSPGQPWHRPFMAVINPYKPAEEQSFSDRRDVVSRPAPSLDKSTGGIWPISTKANPGYVHHFNPLNHLATAASDPTLKLLGMPGGLDIWLFRNT